jgi:hypothetical protein
MSLTKEQLNALTRLGARARLAELVQEMDALLSAFPDLGSQPARPKARPEPPAKPMRKRYRMSAANRRKAAERMKAYWAAKCQAKQPAATPQEKPARKGRRRAKKR